MAVWFSLDPVSYTQASYHWAQFGRFAMIWAILNTVISHWLSLQILLTIHWGCEITYIDRNTWRRINSIGKALQCNTVIKYHCYQKCPFPFSANKENIFSWKVNFQFWMTIDESKLWQRTKKNFQHSSLQSWRHSRYSTQSRETKRFER